MSTVENDEQSDSMNTTEFALHINPSIQPVFSDHIFQVKIENSIAKLFLGQAIDNKIFHNATVVVPLHSLLGLKELLNQDSFEADINAFNTTVQDK